MVLRDGYGIDMTGTWVGLPHQIDVRDGPQNASFEKGTFYIRGLSKEKEIKGIIYHDIEGCYQRKKSRFELAKASLFIG